jgi:sigma-B regulation protein RsbU (phosphoserine phosphatase)
MLSLELIIGISFLYITFLFLVAYYAGKRGEQCKSIISNPTVYSLSIAAYCTSWTFYGSVGRAATEGLDYLLIYLGPTLCAFSWWFLLRKIVRYSKENNITSIADFISSRYGKSQVLGAIVTLVALVGVMPCIALQLRVVTTTFRILCGMPRVHAQIFTENLPAGLHPSFFTALLLGFFGVVFGARRLVSSERHEGLVAALAVESVVKLLAFLIVGIFVTYSLFNGFSDIFSRMAGNRILLDKLTTFGKTGSATYANWFTMLYLSMTAIFLPPWQFHILVIENSEEEHIKKAMWRVPAYLLLISLFVVPIAFGGILYTGGMNNADYFVITLPLQSGHQWLALFAFLGGFSAAAGMVMATSVAVPTMVLNHLIMPIIVRLKPRRWFPGLLINLKRISVFLVAFLGYLYYQIVGETFMLFQLGLLSFAAAAQFGPALIGGLFWPRGNKAGAIAGISSGFIIWFYTLLIPSFIKSGWLSNKIMEKGLGGIWFLKPAELFGLTGFDIWSHSLFWSMFFNVGGYLFWSILFPQEEQEIEQVKKFAKFFALRPPPPARENKRLSRPVTIEQFENLMSKFVGEAQARTAINKYFKGRTWNKNRDVSEFELPELKRFIEKTLAGSVGAAAAGAIVENYLSGMGSRMEPVYDIFGTVRASLVENRETLYVRLRASEIMNRTLDLQIIMDDLLDLLLKEFKLDLAVIRLINDQAGLTIRSFRVKNNGEITTEDHLPDPDPYLGEVLLSNKAYFINDTKHLTKTEIRTMMELENVRSLAHIPIAHTGEPPQGILSVFSKSIVGLFTEPFLELLLSLSGQLSQAVKIVYEMDAKERERLEKEQVLLENVKVARELEIARQIQMSLLPPAPPKVKGAVFAGVCLPAAHVGGDYYDFFPEGENEIGIVIADVSGHSVGAALIMVEARSVLRDQIHSAGNAGNALANLNELLHEDLSRAELLISMFYARYNADDNLLSYANAGHNPPILFRQEPDGCLKLDTEGLILGVKKDVTFEEKNLQLKEGDVVFFYTDGVTESRNDAGELFGVERLCDKIVAQLKRDPQQIIDAVMEEIRIFAGSASLQDDISIIVLKVAQTDADG